MEQIQDEATVQTPTIFCFHCKEHVGVKNLKEGVTEFRSQKVGKCMSRSTWIANCAKCNAKIRSFKKSATTLEIPLKRKRVYKDAHPEVVKG
jgi:hypothetical protein